ncbi:PTS lactose/cellobiose transporter subunit IIA [Peribacillus sp. FSL E2-0218]|uniref:PTS lactose/cellobiose transporter subunit IIA n=1 Tax=Peribacillus sp. FSL E2-0218 TaxID=2921364 RepID=UPI0030EBFD6A
MQTIEGMQTAALQIISYSGEARSHFVEAIREGRAGHYQKADVLIKAGEEAYNKIHQVHFSLIQKEANGDTLPFSLLFIHAEDQMLTTETLKIMAVEMIELCKMVVEGKTG